MPSRQLSNHVLCVGLLAASNSAVAQTWSAVRLHSTEMHSSQGFAADGPLIAGSGATGTHTEPILWNAQTSTWKSLTPIGFEGGGLRTAFGGRQGGRAGTSQTAHAALWSGTVESFVDLHPASNPYISEIHGMSGMEQVGYYRPTVTSPAHRAALWRGTAESFVNLHPAGAFDSEARGVSDGLQGGFYRQTEGSGYHAALWAGTAQSMIDLHPAGAIESQVFAAADGQQVGWSRSPVTRAAMWHGTAQSYVDMGPPGSGFSLIHATCGTAQAGYANFAGTISAVVWFGTATNFVRLDAFIPQGYSQSVATGISQQDGEFFVSGYARNPSGGFEAFAWVGVPSPCTLAVVGVATVCASRRRRCLSRRDWRPACRSRMR